MLHKSEEDAADAGSQKLEKDTTDDVGGALRGGFVKGDDGAVLDGRNTLRRSSRKRRLDVAETDSRDTKGRRKI